jgi:pimeloyl-ACP methyl ester carboxylesterase
LPIFAGPPPLDDPARYRELNRLDRRLAWLSRRVPPAGRAMFAASGWAGRRAAARVSRSEARQLPDADAAVVRGLGDWLGEVTGEGCRQGGGVVDEYRAFVAPWGFAPDEVVAPTRIYQGTVDSLVPPSWAGELAAMIPDATVGEFDGEGHMIAVSRRAEIVRALL